MLYVIDCHNYDNYAEHYSGSLWILCSSSQFLFLFIVLSHTIAYWPSSQVQRNVFLVFYGKNYGDAELRRHWLTPTMKYKINLCK